MSASTPTLIRRWVAVPIAGASLIALAACGGGPAPSTGASTDTGAGASATAGRPDRAQMEAFEKCLSEHGVTGPPARRARHRRAARRRRTDRPRARAARRPARRASDVP